MEEIKIFDAIMVIIFWLNPLIFFEGVFILLAAEKYNKLENQLNKELGWFRKKAVPKLETNIYSLHEWLFKRRISVGIILILYSISSFVLLKNIAKII